MRASTYTKTGILNFRSLKIIQDWDLIIARKHITYTIWIGAKNINFDFLSPGYSSDPGVKQQ